MVVDVEQGIQVILSPTIHTALGNSLVLVRICVLLEVIGCSEDKHESIVEDSIVLVPIGLPISHESLSSLSLEKLGLLVKRKSVHAHSKVGKHIDSSWCVLLCPCVVEVQVIHSIGEELKVCIASSLGILPCLPSRYVCVHFRKGLGHSKDVCRVLLCDIVSGLELRIKHCLGLGRFVLRVILSCCTALPSGNHCTSSIDSTKSLCASAISKLFVRIVESHTLRSMVSSFKVDEGAFVFSVKTKGLLVSLVWADSVKTDWLIHIVFRSFDANLLESVHRVLIYRHS